jgi:hypothetical protein
MSEAFLGVCDGCGKRKSLDAEGRVRTHFFPIDVSRSAVRTVGAGRVRRRCPGSGKPPRRVEP